MPLVEDGPIVVKYGSASCVDEHGIRDDRLEHYSRQISRLLRADSGVVVVASGAVALSRTIMLNRRLPIDPELSDGSLATLGNPFLFTEWQQDLFVQGVTSTQILTTGHEIADPAEKGMLKTTIEEQLSNGWVPIINENDALSDEETSQLSHNGDNDGLAAKIAVLVGARRLCLMTEEQGVLKRDGELVKVVNPLKIRQVKELAMGKDSSKMGRGGMLKKIEAAEMAAKHGIPAHIAHASSRMSAVLAKEVGTYFVPVRPPV